MRSWGHMYGPAMRLKQAQGEADIVTCFQLGLDIQLLAAGCHDWPEQRRVVHRIHHNRMVHGILREELGIATPDAYLLPHAVNGVLRKYLIDTFPELAERSANEIDEFLTRQQMAVQDYFGPDTNQHYFQLRAENIDDPIPDMYHQAVAFIGRQVELYQ